jgi:hypothetical protein
MLLFGQTPPLPSSLFLPLLLELYRQTPCYLLTIVAAFEFSVIEPV